MLEQLGDLAAVQLFTPGSSAVVACQHHTTVAHRPSMGRGWELHGEQVDAHGHRGLLPAFAFIIGIEHVTSLTHRDQPRPGASHAVEQPGPGQRTGAGRHIERVGERGRGRGW
ncbi:hypothetical protein D3C79_931860 [compost metagenome]